MGFIIGWQAERDNSRKMNNLMKMDERKTPERRTSLSKTLNTLMCWLIPAGGRVMTDVVRTRRRGGNLHSS